MTAVLVGALTRALVVASMVVIAATGCAVGDGVGIVQGSFNVLECKFPEGKPPIPLVRPDPTKQIVGPHSLDVDFFVGAPVDSNTPRFPANQMVIRMQRGGARLESADALLFWVEDSAEVARCIRGGLKADGTPEWDPLLCDRSPAVLGPNGEGRLFVGMTYETVKSFFVLNDACASAFVSANALGDCADGTCPDASICPGRGSWISFSRFGNLPSAGTEVKPGHKVDDGQLIAASAFHVEMCDFATVNDALDRVVPLTEPNITATFEGSFSFPLARGAAAQPFP